MGTSCIFCEIVAGRSPASVVYDDDRAMCLMTLRPTRPGECMVIPKNHIDHFTDMPDDLSAHIMVIAQRVARNIRREFGPQRVGMVVHGFGVAHAHLILVPQHETTDITSLRFVRVDDGEVVIDHRQVPAVDRSVLDEHAAQLALEHAG